MNKHLLTILFAIGGLIIGLLVASSNPIMKLIGIGIPTVIILYYHKEIQEIFLEYEANKVIGILFISVLGAGMILIDSLQKTQWQLLLLWGAWLMFNVAMLGKLCLLYEFALVMKDHEHQRHIIALSQQHAKAMMPLLKLFYEGREGK